MENQPVTSSGSTLSQYFTNDPPSLFDNLTINPENPTMMIPQNLQGASEPTDYLDSIDDESDIDGHISEDVRNFWLPYNFDQSVKNNPALLTCPGVLVQEELADTFREIAVKYLTEKELAERQILTADDVTQDIRGLRILIVAGSFRAATNLTARLLKIYGQGFGSAGNPVKHTAHSLELWFTRLKLLSKMGQYDLLQKESEAFGSLNRPDMFYDFYPEMYDGRKGSMATFNFRLMIAEIPIYTGSPKAALDNLTELMSICTEIKIYFKDQKENFELWHQREIRVLYSIINCAIEMQDYSLIDDIMKRLLFEEPDIKKEERRSLFSTWGRIYLQVGDVFGAEQKFSEARRLREMNSAVDFRDLVDKGLVAVAENDFQEAYANFQKALQENENTMLLNNMGVCLLYCGKLQDAISIFEKAINLSPKRALHESILINLSTLYELESSNSKTKKLNLLRLINRYKPDLNMSLEFCLKLQSNN